MGKIRDQGINPAVRQSQANYDIHLPTVGPLASPSDQMPCFHTELPDTVDTVDTVGHLPTSILCEQEYESNGWQSPTVTRIERETVSLDETATSSRKRALSYSEQHENSDCSTKPRLRFADDQVLLFVACESEKCKARGFQTPEDSYYTS